MLLQLLAQQSSRATYLPGCGLIMGPLCAYLTAKKGYPTKDIVLSGIAGFICWPIALILVIAQKDKTHLQQQYPPNIPVQPHNPQQPYGQQGHMAPSNNPQQQQYHQGQQQAPGVQQPNPVPPQVDPQQQAPAAPPAISEPEIPAGKKRCPACFGINSESYKRCQQCGADF